MICFYANAYEGRPIICDEFCDWSQTDGEWIQDGDEWVFIGTVEITNEGQFFGAMTIDESLFPGGSLANAVLEIAYDDAEYDHHTGTSMPSTHSYRVTTPTSAFTGMWEIGTGTLRNVGIIDESWQFFWSSIDYHANAGFAFDAFGNIADWWGNSAEGGSGDPFTGSYGDYFASGAVSRGPGTWTRTEAPAPVPLPASGLLLLAGAGALAALRRRS